MNDLPYDSQIKWLGFEGSRYVNTKYTPNENTRIEFRMQFPDATKNNTGYYVFSARQRASSADPATTMHCGMRIRRPRTIYAQYQSSEVQFSNTRNLSTADIVDGVFTPPSATLRVGDSILASCTIGTFTGNSTYPLLICGYHLNYNSDVSIRVYNFKIYEGDTLVRDYVPVRVEDVGKLYDQVNGVLYSPTGSGTSILGPDLGGGVQRCTN